MKVIEPKYDLWGCLEALMALEAAIRDHINNMHMDMYIIEVTDFKSKERFGRRSFYRAIALLLCP